MTPRTQTQTLTSSWTWTSTIALLASVVVTGCASSPPAKPPAPASPGSVAAQSASAPAGKTKPNMEYWSGRTDLIRAPAPPKPTELALPPSAINS